MSKFSSHIFVGYLPRMIMEKSGLKSESGEIWLSNPIVEEICSISDCISVIANGDDIWKRNELGFYDSEEMAINIVPKTIPTYELFGYKLFPFQFDKGKCIEYQFGSKAIENLSQYTSIGFDVISKSSSSFFECSPLSCNHACETFPVNRYCLFENVDEAFKCATQISLEIADAKITKRPDGIMEYNGTWEPGPYYAFQVYRKTKNIPVTSDAPFH